jgi:23S rRNA pseudouridine955/2504/2580 synthase
VQRLFLHASRLSFAHPVTGEKVALQAALPAQIKQFLEKRLK